MTSVLNFIFWDVNPEIFQLGGLSIRWYGLFFACGFLVGQYVMTLFFKWEKKPLADLDSLLLYMVISTVVGARLGHCLFYEPEYYLSHPWQILNIREGGLASHGATVAILIAVWLFAYKRDSINHFFYRVRKVLSKIPLLNLFVSDKPVEKSNTSYAWLYLLDRLVIVIAFAGMCIRLGNLMNSEIIGKPTQVVWAFIFASVDYVPRHPSQLYEAIFCLFLFIGLFITYAQLKSNTPNGFIFGLFVVLLFTQRILVEFTKENQVAFENNLLLNMGQLLSLPLLIFGLYVLWRSLTKPLPW